MNRVVEFYSRPSGMSMYAIYSRPHIKQRGGFVKDFIQSQRRQQKQRQRMTKSIVGALFGLGQGISAYKRFQKPYNK